MSITHTVDSRGSDPLRIRSFKFLTSAFSIADLDIVSKLNVEMFKIPSGEITNIPLLEHIAKYNNSDEI